MVRRRWPDIVIVLGILALVAGGVWALWGDDLRDRLDPSRPKVEQPGASGSVT